MEDYVCETAITESLEILLLKAEAQGPAPACKYPEPGSEPYQALLKARLAGPT